MKRILFIMTLLLPLAAIAQNGQCIGCSKQLTKYEMLINEAAGTIMKIVDTDKNRLLVSSGALETGIRTVKFGESFYFLKMEQRETLSSSSELALIGYDDLVSINEALQTLVAEIKKDKTSRPEYLENKYITDDGFEVGYTVSKGEAHWFIKLERNSTNVIYINNKDNLVKFFKDAQSKIEALGTVE